MTNVITCTVMILILQYYIPCVHQVHVGPVRPVSKGTVRLKSIDPSQHPAIDPNYLSTHKDIEDFKLCIKYSREIFQQKVTMNFTSKCIVDAIIYEYPLF